MNNSLLAHQSQSFRELSAEEVTQVSGGLPFAAVVGVGMLADTSFWGALSMAFGAGFGFGGFLNGFFGAPAEAPAESAPDNGGGLSGCASGYGSAGDCGF